MGLSIRDAAQNLTANDVQALPSENHVWRVVSEILEEQGQAAAYLCGFEGRLRVTRLNKHASPLNTDSRSSIGDRWYPPAPLGFKSVMDRRIQSETPFAILPGSEAMLKIRELKKYFQ